MRVRLSYIFISFLAIGFLVAALVVWGGRKTWREGFCRRVVDGDTLILEEQEEGGKTLILRLAGVDAPEKSQLSQEGQPIGRWAGEFLRARLEGRKVFFSGQRWSFASQAREDPYGRFLGWVWFPGTPRTQRGVEEASANFMLVREGLALIYPFARFSSPQSKRMFAEAMREAFLRRKGIWKTQGFLSPYQFRKMGRGQSSRLTGTSRGKYLKGK